MKKSWLSGTWGFAEATLFFILPDVPLSYYALDKKHNLTRLCCITLLGALLGGGVMYCWGQYNFDTAYHLVESVPAINDELMATVHEQLKSSGVLAVFIGPLQGLPYKTFAVQASAAHISIIEFLLMSIPARLVRFLVIAYVARWIAFNLLRHLQRRHLVAVWGGVWLVVYALYFYYFPS